MCMKKAYMFLTVIVPRPNNPKHKIDVYLQPLIKELTFLWETGVEAFDISKKQNFQLRAALMWTISDFPAYSMLSG
uniref:Putative ovule protein n=1 Tax=Solanum chacoense TaxID=4108 RepID=A0A0V0GVB4_SOLCH